MDKRAIQPNIVSRTTRTAVAAMLASTMCMPLPALAQESRTDNSPASELQEPSNEETLGDKPDSTLAAANDSSPQQAVETAIEEAPVALSAGEDAESTLTYSIDEDGNATITGTTDEKTKRGIIIPESIDGHPVTAITAYAFSGKAPQSDYDLSDRTDLWLTSIYIPNSVKSIGGFAFENNKNLESVHLPENGCTIGHKDRWDAYGSIFSECISLKTITIPNGLDIIDGTYRGTCISALSAPKLESVIFSKSTSAICRGILANCPSLKSVDIPDSVKSIEAYAFSGCEALEAVRLPEGGCEIGSTLNGYGSTLFGNILEGCTSLTELYIPKGITTISDENDYAWDYSMFSAPALKSVTFEDGVNALATSMFKNCEALESVNIPNGVKTIPSYCFSNCKALASLDIPESVKAIEGYAFKGCGFASIDLPDTVKAIHDRAFADCTSLSTVNLPTKGVELGGSYYPSNSNSGTFAGCTALKSITLPDGITGGMLGAPALTNVKFAPGIKKINGLGGCTALSNIIVPNSARQICEGSFSGCVSLQRIDIPEGVTSISNSAFGYCKSLQQVNLPDSLRKIGYNSFGNCTSLQDLQIPADVAEIGGGAYINCTSLESVSLPSNIQQINYSTFENCTSLKAIDLPISVRSIYEHAFYKCYDMVNATITSNTTNISSNAFDLSGLENGTITCVKGSAADSFAQNAGIKRNYYTDNTDYQDVANSSISLNTYDIRFDGTSAEPKPNVNIGNRYLYSGSDFDIYYENNTAPGTATIVITSKGKYHGTVRSRSKLTKPNRAARCVLRAKAQQTHRLESLQRLSLKARNGSSSPETMISPTR